MNCKHSQVPTRYVVGFLFDEAGKTVVLINKNRPAWQAGCLNGVGGKVEGPVETPEGAMSREFGEETGQNVPYWDLVAKIRGDDFLVYVYRAFDSEVLANVETTTDEVVGKYDVAGIANRDCVANVKWLVHLCLSKGVKLPVEVQYER